MTLTFDERGLLAPGVHDASLTEIETHFGRFQRTNRRMTLFKSFGDYVKEVMQTGWACTILIDGSFVMPAVDEPNDIDVILLLPADWDVQAALKPFEYNVVSKKYTKKAYNIEVYAALDGSAAAAAYVELFSKVRAEWCRQFGWPVESRKGVVRIVS